MFVAHHGVDTQRFRPGSPSTGCRRRRAGQAVDRPAGRRASLRALRRHLEPRKDVPTLVARLRPCGRPATPTRCWCWPGEPAGDRGRRAGRGGSGVADRVVRTGYVPTGPSRPCCARPPPPSIPALYEGFGLPALEALACGAPLITTQGTAMEEVAGEAAVLVPRATSRR